MKLLAEIEKRINEENARPKKRYISPSTREEVYAVYYDTLRRKIEERGTATSPKLAGRKLYGELTMIVTINHDGRVLDTEVVETSGNPRWTGAPPTIAKAAGPFGKFSDAMRKPGRPDRRRLALQVHARRHARNQAHQPLRIRRGPLLRHGQSRGTQQVAVDPRPLRRAHRRAGGIRQAPDPAGRLRRRPCAPSSPKAARAATSPCPSSSRPLRWSAGAARARRWPMPATSSASTARSSSATTPTASAWWRTSSATRAALAGATCC
jgi:hypothetical protein